MQEAPVKVLLVGVDIGEEADFEHSMEELASLAEAAEKEVVGQIVQRLDHVNKALYIGTGKVAEVRRLAGKPVRAGRRGRRRGAMRMRADGPVSVERSFVTYPRMDRNKLRSASWASLPSPVSPWG